MFSLNEQPNAIADYASLTLNNFVSSVGRKYINDEDVDNIRAKADKCHIKVDLSSSAWNVVRKPQPLLQTLSAFDAASDIDTVDKSTLMKLQLWDLSLIHIFIGMPYVPHPVERKRHTTT